ncbi:MAG: MFS transporter, partial [Planctomycetes bacterium]|nr:MFS transporter [Planctomycetota bacterium]
MASALHPSHPVYKVRRVGEKEIPWMLRRNIWTGVLGSVSVTFMTTGVFFTAYCHQMGMEAYQFGLLSTIVAFLMPISLFSASVEEKFGQRKYPWFILALGSRLLLLPLLFGFLVPISPWIIMVLVGTLMGIGYLISPLWQSWTWDYIPSDTFGRFTAKRTFWVVLFRTLVALGGAAAIHFSAPESRLPIICGVFALFLTMGIVDLIFHVRIPEPPRKSRPAKTTTKFKTAFLNRRFRNLLLGVGLWYFAIFIASPFCIPYMMKELGFEGNFLLATTMAYAIPAVGTLFFLPLWGRLADTRYPGLVLSLSCLFWATIPLFYHLARPESAMLPLTIAWLVAGIFPAGYTVCLPQLARRLSGVDKTMPLSLIFVTVSIGMMMGSGVGTLIVRLNPVNSVFRVSFAARVT